MFNSTSWVGYASAVTMILISFAAAFLAPKRQGQLSPGYATPEAVEPGQAAAPALPQPPPPPIAPIAVDATFMGTHTFGHWTLVCENIRSRAAAAGPERRICRSNAQRRVRANNQDLLAAGFNVLFAGPERQPAVLFRLPPAASAGDHVNFAIDNNTNFQAPLTRCGDNECIVQGILPPEALAQMKTGKVISIVYTAKIKDQPKPIRVDQSLYGFTESFEALTNATGPSSSP